MDKELLIRACRELLRSGQLNKGHWESVVLSVSRSGPDGYRWKAYISDPLRQDEDYSKGISKHKTTTKAVAVLAPFGWENRPNDSNTTTRAFYEAMCVMISQGWEAVHVTPERGCGVLRRWFED